MSEILKKKALSYLGKDLLSHIDMIEPIRRKTADILYADTNGVIIHESKSGALMSSLDFGENLSDFIDPEKYSLFAVHQEETAISLLSSGRLTARMDTWQYTYLKGKPIKGDYSDIHPLTDEFSDLVAANYGEHEKEYIDALIKNGLMFGLFENGSLAGFIGEHLEGAIGLLAVLPEFRRKGYGLKLEKYMINRSLSRGEIPFGQVVTDNEKSLALQQRLGMEKSTQKTFWVWQRD